MARPKFVRFKPLPRPAPVNGVPQWGVANPAAGRASKPALQYARSLFGGGTGSTTQSPGGGGGNPYGGILNEFLNSSKARFSADSAADAAQRDAAIQRMIISYGQVPDFDKLGIGDQTRGYLKGALSDKVRQLAEANTKEGTSVYARQAKANEVANRRIPAQLAARGMLRSGQTGSDLGDQAQAYKIQGFDTLNELLGGVEGTVGNFLAAERARADALAQAELQAQMAAYENYGGDMYGDAPGSANPYNRAQRPPGLSFSGSQPKTGGGRRRPAYSFTYNGRRVKGWTLRPPSGTRGGGV